MDITQMNLDEKGRDTTSQTASALPVTNTMDGQLNTTAGPKEPISILSSPSKPYVTFNARDDLPPDVSLAAIFRFHMGIENDNALLPPHLARKRAIDPIDTGSSRGRRAVNLGIYNRAIREELDCSRRYKIWSLVINSALGLQILFAAILTALGAGSGPHDVVAIFGALNTVIAGFVTYLKGTGLPMRVKYFHNQWLKLRAYIEQRERDFASDDLSKTHRLGYNELIEEIEIVEKMYHNIRKDIEKHTPDSFGGGDKSNNEEGPGEGAPQARLAERGLHALRNRITGNTDDTPAPAVPDASDAPDPVVPEQSHRAGIESHVRSVVEDVEKRLADRLHSRISKIEGRIDTALPGKDVEKGNASAIHAGAIDELDSSSDPEMHDVNDVALGQVRHNLSKALQAQDQAEARIRELEAKLAQNQR